MMRQLDGMDVKQLQTLAAEINKRMRNPRGTPGEPEDWRKRLLHIQRAIGERTIRVKPGDSRMENLKKRLIKTKLPPGTSTKAKGTATHRGQEQTADHTRTRPDAMRKQQQHDNGDIQCSMCAECDDCHECHQCISCYSCHECPQLKNGEPHRCINL